MHQLHVNLVSVNTYRAVIVSHSLVLLSVCVNVLPGMSTDVYLFPEATIDLMLTNRIGQFFVLGATI